MYPDSPQRIPPMVRPPLGRATGVASLGLVHNPSGIPVPGCWPPEYKLSAVTIRPLALCTTEDEGERTTLELAGTSTVTAHNVSHFALSNFQEVSYWTQPENGLVLCRPSRRAKSGGYHSTVFDCMRDWFYIGFGAGIYAGKVADWPTWDWGSFLEGALESTVWTIQPGMGRWTGALPSPYTWFAETPEGHLQLTPQFPRGKRWSVHVVASVWVGSWSETPAETWDVKLAGPALPEEHEFNMAGNGQHYHHFSTVLNDTVGPVSGVLEIYHKGSSVGHPADPARDVSIYLEPQQESL